MQNNELSFVAKAAPLLLVLFIDGMGLSLVFPILTGLIFEPKSQFLASSLQTPLMQYVIYGAIMSIFMLCWFFGAAILGDLSDKIGRKKSLIICLTGAFLSYLVSALAVEVNSLILLIIGRVISGITAGSQPIAQAAIIDISEPKHKARNIGYILLVLSLGFVLGPLIGGILADNSFVSWFTYATPFYFASIISFINILLLLALFKETFVSKNTTFAIDPYQAIHIFISAFQNKRVKTLSIILFIFIFGWSSFFSFVPIYLLKLFDFSPTKVSVFLAVMGVGFGIGNGYLVNFVAKRFPLRFNYIYSILIAAIMILAMVVIGKSTFNWMIVAPIATAISVGYACLLTMFSDQVDAESQGWVMGVTGSVMAFVFGVNGFIMGLIAAFSPILPMYIATFCLLISVITMIIFFKETNKV